MAFQQVGYVQITDMMAMNTIPILDIEYDSAMQEIRFRVAEDPTLSGMFSLGDVMSIDVFSIGPDIGGFSSPLELTNGGLGILGDQLYFDEYGASSDNPPTSLALDHALNIGFTNPVGTYSEIFTIGSAVATLNTLDIHPNVDYTGSSGVENAIALDLEFTEGAVPLDTYRVYYSRNEVDVLNRTAPYVDIQDWEQSASRPSPLSGMNWVLLSLTGDQIGFQSGPMAFGVVGIDSNLVETDMITASATVEPLIGPGTLTLQSCSAHVSGGRELVFSLEKFPNSPGENIFINHTILFGNVSGGVEVTSNPGTVSIVVPPSVTPDLIDIRVWYSTTLTTLYPTFASLVTDVPQFVDYPTVIRTKLLTVGGKAVLNSSNKLILG